MRSFSIGGIVSVAAILSLSQCHAQDEPLHLLQGQVVDANGAAVAGAKVIAQCGPYRSETVSDAEGLYALHLRQNTCTIHADAKGFAPYSQVFEGRRGGDLRVQLSAGTEESVTVTARQDAVDVTKIAADPMDLPLAIESVPISLVQDQGFTRLIDAVRNVSGVVSKEAYFGVTDTFNVRVLMHPAACSTAFAATTTAR